MKLHNILTALLLLACLACSQGDKPAAEISHTSLPTNEELTIGMSQEFENMNPIIMSMQATTYIYKMVNRNLTTMSPENEWIPQIVKEIPTLENGLAQVIDVNGKPTLVADWEILDNAKWGDGTPVTARDVAFAREIALSDNVSVGEREVYSAIARIDIDPQNPKKFRTYYDKIRWDFSQNGTFYLVPEHLERPIFEQYKDVNEGYAKNSNYTANPTNPGLYCGPYRVQEIALGSHVILVPNEHFYGTPPNIKKLVLRYIPDTGTLEASLRSGTIDMISVLGLKFDQALKFEETVKENNLPYKVLFTPGTVYEHIDLQLSNPKLQDARVRKALVYGINRDLLTKELFKNRQQKAIHNIAPVDQEWYTEDPNSVVTYEYSRAKANELLDAAGWKMGEGGFRYKNGEKLEFVLMTTSGDKTREQVQVFLQDQWHKIGVDISMKNEPARVYFGETTRKSKYSGMAMYAWISSPENSPKSSLHSKNIPTEKNGWSGQNTPRWVNHEVDSLLDAVETEMDADKRREMIHKVLYHYTNEVPVIPLYYRSNISVIPENMTGYKMPGHQFSATNHVEKWNLEAPSDVAGN